MDRNICTAYEGEVNRRGDCGRSIRGPRSCLYYQGHLSVAPNEEIYNAVLFGKVLQRSERHLIARVLVIPLQQMEGIRATTLGTVTN